MIKFKSLIPFLMFVGAFQMAFANCPGFTIAQGSTNFAGWTNYSVPAVPGATYLWSPTGNLTIQSGQGTNQIWVSGSLGTLFVTRDANNIHCYTSTPIDNSSCGNLQPLSVYISGDFALDLDETGTFTANPSGGSGNYTYKWYRSDTNNGLSVVGLSSTYSAQYENEGTYWVKVEVYDSCGLIAVSSKFIEAGCGFTCEQ